jgi:hypothetical protein
MSTALQQTKFHLSLLPPRVEFSSMAMYSSLSTTVALIAIANKDHNRRKGASLLHPYCLQEWRFRYNGRRRKNRRYNYIHDPNNNT